METTFRPVEKRNFYLTQTHLHLVPLLGVIPSEFRRDLLHHKTAVLGYHAALFLRSYV